MERRMQARALPRRLVAGDTTAAVEALLATRPPQAADDETGAAESAAGSRPAAPETSSTPDGPAVAAPATASRTARGDYSLSRQLGLGVARVVIDAGHGGHDPGAKVKGLTEAGLVLDIALRLEQLLRKQPGVDVVMTRRTDTYVPLEERTDMANRAGADLFVSIHANASANPRTRGVETYVLNFATSPDVEVIAARENAGGSRTMRNLPEIVKTIATNNKLDESRELARFVQTALHNQLRKGDATLRNLGVKQAPFMVLVGATMPAILTEVAFVTNQDDASRMKNDKYRQDVAEALLAGITRYQQSLKRSTAPAVAVQAAP
jgi:N-acetylmuramoyl-L-alanine amidase